MAEYIKREDALFKLMQDGCLASSIESIKNLPAADAAPVVHGRWQELTNCSNAGVYCSVCSKRVYARDYARCNKRNKIRSNFCPNCGSAMGRGIDKL